MKMIITDSVIYTANILKKGGIAAFPTETVYGLGANVYDEKAISKIFNAKGRPADNPLIVHIAHKKHLEILAREIPEYARKIIRQFFPGPIALIFKKNEIIPDVVTAGLDTIAIRMPSSKIALDLIKKCGFPIAAPSSNLSGSPSPTSFVHVLQDLKGKIPCILIGPKAKYGIESTVVDCTGRYPVILRPGVVTLEQLKKINKNIKYQSRTLKIKSPGQKYRHYAPKAKVKIIRNYELGIRDLKINAAYIGLNNKSVKKFDFVKVCRTNEEYAKNLFSFFRECDTKGIKVIYCQRVKDSGVGVAIMNRLKKAINN
jgi:L-threonylcarbamoyladenylate synthase